METRSEIGIDASAATIFAYASATERWPEFLPHYRSVRVLARDGVRRTVAMAAWRGRIPIAWVAEQIDDPLEPAIRFRHLAGPTKGMEVVWRFAPLCRGTRVTIEHRFEAGFPLLGEWWARRVIGDFFIEYVAARTLARMKSLAEGA